MPYGVPKRGRRFFMPRVKRQRASVPSGRRASPGRATGLTCVPSRAEASIPDERGCSPASSKITVKTAMGIVSALRPSSARQKSRQGSCPYPGIFPDAYARPRPAWPVSLRHARAAQQLAAPKSEPPAKRVVCSGPVRACYRLRLKTLAFTLFKPSALAALATP